MAGRRVDSAASAEEALAAIVGGRRWVIVSSIAAGRAGIDRLRHLGASDVLVVAGSRGVGELPDCEIAYLGMEPVPDLMGAIRATEAALADPPPDVVAAVERFDPGREAMVISEPAFALADFLGRPVHGARRPAWAALEDKTLVDDLWDRAGVTRAPMAIVPVQAATGTAASLATEAGTVWAADNSRGWHGGGEYTRWVPPGREAEATAWFADRAESVRVMPFLDGIPCSIHGFVTGTGVAAFRPYELLVLRRADGRGFLYAGGATFWDPPRADRSEMRAVARRVGEVLADEVGYLGPFSVDGVMTSDGFRPTELNPRQSRGLGDQAASVDGFSLGGLTRAVIDGLAEVDPGWLESTVVGAADRTRSGRANVGMAMEPPEVDPVDIVFGEDGATAVDGGGMARMEVGSGPIGSVLLLTFDPARVRPGPSLASAVASGIDVARERWGLPVPACVPAPDVRG